MNIKQFIPPVILPGLEWLGKKTGWFGYTLCPQGIRDIWLELPPQDSTINPTEYVFLQRWISSCRKAADFGLQNLAEVSTIYSMSRMVALGPKVFFPTDAQCRAMLNVEINLDKSYYRQPYPTFAIWLPQSFVDACAEHSPNKRFPKWASATMGADGKALFLTAQYGLEFDGMLNVMSLHIPDTIEQGIVIKNQVRGPAEEYIDAERCQRLCLNFALMLTNFPHLLKYRDEMAAAGIARKFLKQTDPITKQGLAQKKALAGPRNCTGTKHPVL